ncbi:hypothetical protein GOP47_0014420 [Adiantum capillus-veneris]|uniref:Uncharacterized protein n=1 Tax=Adiantum capillus-veneris TaxID=13818 RepID=A0A9D4UM97_ADICA|nr:hypothetical protein GOP47_0014420 [Adiantum capillus-veneris]
MCTQCSQMVPCMQDVCQKLNKVDRLLSKNRWKVKSFLCSALFFSNVISATTVLCNFFASSKIVCGRISKLLVSALSFGPSILRLHLKLDSCEDIPVENFRTLVAYGILYLDMEVKLSKVSDECVGIKGFVKGLSNAKDMTACLLKYGFVEGLLTWPNEALCESLGKRSLEF